MVADKVLGVADIISEATSFAEGKHHSKRPHLFKTNEVFLLAGLAGFGPTGDGVKVRYLTAWRQPNI